MRSKKCLAAGVALCLALGTLAGCGGEQAYRLPHFDGTGEGTFSSELFYQNEMTMFGADPSVIYISDTESEDYGYFYLYPTSDYDFGVQAFAAYRSRNMIDWEFVGAAFDPEDGSWAKTRLYAPEVVYDSEAKKYFMFFSAQGYDRDNLYFESKADLSEYNRVKADVNAQGIEPLESEIANYSTQFGEEGEVDGYTSEQTEIVRSALKDYQERKVNLGSDAQRILTLTREAVLKIKTVKLATKSGATEYSLGVAVSDSPRGPFKQYTNISGTEEYDENKREIGLDTPYVMHEDFYENCSDEVKEKLQDIMCMIDAHPFEAPNGDKYLYFSATYPSQEYIYGLKIGKSWTDDPDWDSVTPLLRHRYKTVDGKVRTDYLENSNRIDEAPFVYYDAETQKYYLTFSINGCFDKTYCVAQAVGDTPLGPFTKIDRSKGGFVISSDPSWDHVAAPGHHSFVSYGGKLYIAYQGLYNCKYGGGSGMNRGVCVDEVKFVTNQDGQKVMYANGPTRAPMPLIGDDAEYHNIAGEATVTAAGQKGDVSASVLNDGLITYTQYHDLVKEFEMKKGKTTITLSFDGYRTIRAIQIFNSKNLETAFKKIDRIEFDFTYTDENGTEITDTAYIGDLMFDFDRYITEWNGELADVMRPGGSVCVEFNELKVKTIRIIVNADAPANISEIFVLGK